MNEKENPPGKSGNGESTGEVMRCDLCAYSRRVMPDPKAIGRTVRVCEWGPPPVVLAPVFTPDGKTAGLQPQTVLRIMPDSGYCHQFEPRDAPEIEPTRLV